MLLRVDCDVIHKLSSPPDCSMKLHYKSGWASKANLITPCSVTNYYQFVSQRGFEISVIKMLSQLLAVMMREETETQSN